MAKAKEHDSELSDQDLPISFRLYEPQAAMLRRLTEASRGKSVHEMARTLLILALEQEPLRDGLRQVEQARADIDELRKGLAKSVEAILLNLRLELPEKDIKAWVFEKLWPQTK